MKLSGYRRHLCSTKAVHYHMRAAMKPNTAEDPAAESSNILRCYDQKDERVLLETANFIVINKPFDVRMNGDFDVTTEKLLVHWFANTTTKSFKFVHELDYATSGAVCVARNKDAAAIASSSFANRLTHKKYLAVLQGHLDISKWPLRDERIAASYVSQPKKKAKTDYDSVSKQDDEWQVEVMTENLAVSYSAFEALSTRRRCGDPSLQQQELISTLQRVSIEQFKKDSRLRKTLRKVLRANGIELALAPSVKPVPLLADVAAEVPVEGQNEQLLQQTGGQAMPHETVYRIRDDSAQGGQTLIVSVPLTELPGEPVTATVTWKRENYPIHLSMLIFARKAISAAHRPRPPWVRRAKLRYNPALA